MITYRKAIPEDIRPALNLALRMFMEFDAPDYGAEHTERMRLSIDDRITNPDIYLSGKRLMYVALHDKKVIGIIETYGNNRIALLFVDGNCQRQGIATELMSRVICDLKMSGFDKVVLNSSPHGLPFYKRFGFIPIEVEKNINTPWKTPMSYTPNEIWDVLDENRNLTGRYVERGRPKWRQGDYHLVVHVWKRNSKGEWLIDKRANRGTVVDENSLDGKWETTGGSAIAGDSSLDAALRETKEELGLDLDPKKGHLFYSYTNKGFNGYTGFVDVWIFDCDCSLDDIILQESETCDVMWASGDQIKEMIANGEFISREIYPYLDELL